ncbi:TDT family transporter [Streptomyces sp. NPDC057694]|uniref:TDT family transporter n=1 Tax=Streptomyces sp. NPDC057694 TaxID=3346216 RepID=UPI0036C72123
MASATSLHPSHSRRHADRRLLRDLDRPSDLFRNLGPNWFASIMGTGIVANASAVVPYHVTGLRLFGTLVWALASAVLVALSAAWVVHWIRFRDIARGHAHNPVMAHFWGAPAMALLTVGAGTLTLGRGWIGEAAAVRTDAVLWAAGTLLGLVTCVWIPYLAMTEHQVADDSAFGGWLMPIVPPMVSAATGAALVPHVPSGQARLTMLMVCYAMFGISLFASLVIITQLWTRLVHHKVGPAAMVPTLWIVLGPLGQSVTAANALGAVAHFALPAPYATGAAAFAVFYAVPTWGFAMMWLALASRLTLRAVRTRLPFTLTWWSFTFPVGTCVTGTCALAARLHSSLFDVTGAALFVLLLGAWAVVAVRTLRGSLRGTLFLAPAPGPTGR